MRTHMSMLVLLLGMLLPLAAQGQPAQPPQAQAQAPAQQQPTLAQYLAAGVVLAQRGGQYTQDEANLVNSILVKAESLAKRGGPFQPDEAQVMDAANAIRAALSWQQQGGQGQPQPSQQGPSQGQGQGQVQQAPGLHPPVVDPQNRWVSIVLGPYVGFGLGMSSATPPVLGQGGIEFMAGPTRYPVLMALRLGLRTASRVEGVTEMSRFAPDIAAYVRVLLGHYFDVGLGYHWSTYSVTLPSRSNLASITQPNPMIHSALMQMGFRWSGGRVFVEVVPGYLQLGEQGGVHANALAGIQIPINLY